MMWGFGHIRVIERYNPLIHNSVSIINLVIRVVINLVLHMVMVKVVWVLVTPTLPSKKFIVGFMVDILCRIWLKNIQP